ncbi:hypothetical protein, partial [Methanoregula sp.]|uniref:hypothetical protein n=1 Tax=Methanoregula sp. TaxID=2052170 RepID=UPI003C775C32
LEFCHCAICDRGYRELQAGIINGTEKKNLTAQSREVVIKASYEKIDGMNFDISGFLESLREKNVNQKAEEMDDTLIKNVPSGKITIEIDCDVLDNAVLNVLKSEKGREVIQSIPRKYRKLKSKE